MAFVEMAGQLEQWLRMEIEPTLVWDYPTIDAMTAYLEAQYVDRTSSS
jgi:acyl carrier protein